MQTKKAEGCPTPPKSPCCVLTYEQPFLFLPQSKAIWSLTQRCQELGK